MAPPSEEATKKVAITEVLPEFPSFYQNFYDVLRNGAAPIVKNDEVRKVLSLIDSVFDLVKS